MAGPRPKETGMGFREARPGPKEAGVGLQEAGLRRQETAYRRQDRREYGASQELAPPRRQPDTFYWPTNNRYQGLGNF